MKIFFSVKVVRMNVNRNCLLLKKEVILGLKLKEKIEGFLRILDGIFESEIG